MDNFILTRKEVLSLSLEENQEIESRVRLRTDYILNFVCKYINWWDFLIEPTEVQSYPLQGGKYIHSDYKLGIMIRGEFRIKGNLRDYTASSYIFPKIWLWANFEEELLYKNL